MRSPRPRPKEALALGREPSRDEAPRVIAKGRGELAEQILAIARAHGIPIWEDGGLLELLSRLELGDEVPAELFHLVAEVFAFVCRVDERWQGKTMLSVQEKNSPPPC